MNQPKFKFGDRVKRVDADGSFTVDEIKFCRVYHRLTGFYFYNNGLDNQDWVREERLELVIEPQKKKLYAYSYEMGGPVELFKSEQEAYDYQVSSCTILKRETNYDIEYPESK